MSQDPLGGLLGSLLGGSGQAGGNSGGIGQLIQAAIKMFMENKGGQANLNGFLDQLKGAGLGDAADSWVGSGANTKVTPEQLQAALGPEKLDALAKQAGMSSQEAAKDLSLVLPEMVNKMTPDGQLPDAKALQDQFNAFFNNNK